MTCKFYVQATDEAKRAAVIQLPTANTRAKKQRTNRKQGLAISGGRAEFHVCTALAELDLSL